MSIVRSGLRALHLIGAYAIANTQAAMEYRAAFWVQIGIMFSSDWLWIAFWWTFFRQFPLGNGWQGSDIVILWAVTGLASGISLCVFGNTPRLASLIMNGGLDVYLGMPRNVLLHVCIAATDPSSWGDILFALGAYVLLVRPDPWHIALFLLLSMLAACIFTAFLIILGSLAFFLGNTEGLAQQMFNALITFSTYPMSIFDGTVKLLLFTIIPAGFISFVPLQLLHHFSWSLLAAMIGATLVFVGLAIGLFHLGLRRYESGNLLGMQG